YAYYLSDAKDLGNNELMIYVRNMVDELEWFKSLSSSYKSLVKSEEQRYMQSILRIAEIAVGRNDSEFVEKLEYEWSRVEPSYTLKEILSEQKR
ncbi:MAG: hypothetical protein ACOCWB_04195, partial [Bacteroidota bacterium]